MLNKYSKQIMVPEIGADGQNAIQQAKILCVGAGGLGSATLLYLVGAGVGKIGIIDGDTIEASNLHRQILFQETQIGLNKAEAAKENLQKLNSAINLEAYLEYLTSKNALHLFENYDIIIDGTDNFDTKYLINDAAVKLKKPVVFGSVTGLEGQVSIFSAGDGSCYRCLYPAPVAPITTSAPIATVTPASCDTAGVLGPVVGIIGTIQATECLKLIISKNKAGFIRPLSGTLLTLDAREMLFMSHTIKKNPTCLVCSVPSDQINLIETVSSDEIFSHPSDYQLIDVRELAEWNLSRIPGAIHLPLSQIQSTPQNLPHPFEAKTAPTLHEKKIVLYCASGVRSLNAIQCLNAAGFPHVYQLFGGISGIHKNRLITPTSFQTGV